MLYHFPLSPYLSTIALQSGMYQHSVLAANGIHAANYMGNKTGHQHLTHFPMHYKDEITVGTNILRILHPCEKSNTGSIKETVK